MHSILNRPAMRFDTTNKRMLVRDTYGGAQIVRCQRWLLAGCCSCSRLQLAIEIYLQAHLARQNNWNAQHGCFFLWEFSMSLKEIFMVNDVCCVKLERLTWWNLINIESLFSIVLQFYI